MKTTQQRIILALKLIGVLLSVLVTCFLIFRNELLNQAIHSGKLKVAENPEVEVKNVINIIIFFILLI